MSTIPIDGPPARAEAARPGFADPEAIEFLPDPIELAEHPEAVEEDGTEYQAWRAASEARLAALEAGATPAYASESAELRYHLSVL